MRSSSYLLRVRRRTMVANSYDHPFAVLTEAVGARQERVSVGEVVLSIKEGEFSWSKKATTPTLEGVDLTVRKGELVGVLGRVGAGKVCVYSCSTILNPRVDKTL